jgi:hypothetical protein
MSDPERFKLAERLGYFEKVGRLAAGIFEQNTSGVERLKQATTGPADGFTIQVIEDRIRGSMIQAEGRIGAARTAQELIGIVYPDLG